MGSPLMVRAKCSQQQLQTRVCDQQNLPPNIKPPKKSSSASPPAALSALGALTPAQNATLPDDEIGTGSTSGLPTGRHQR